MLKKSEKRKNKRQKYKMENFQKKVQNGKLSKKKYKMDSDVSCHPKKIKNQKFFKKKQQKFKAKRKKNHKMKSSSEKKQKNIKMDQFQTRRRNAEERLTLPKNGKTEVKIDNAKKKVKRKDEDFWFNEMKVFLPPSPKV